MKVLIVSVGKMAGGIENYTISLGKTLRRMNYEVYYAVRKNSWLNSQLDSNNKICLELGIHLIQDIIKLKLYVKKNKINLLHINSNNGLLVSVAIASNRYTKKLAVIHGDVKVDQMKKGKFIVAMYSLLETFLINHSCNKCIAVSESMKNILCNRGVKEDKIKIIHNAIEPYQYDSLPDYESEVLQMCNVGNLLPIKNQMTILRALSIINDKKMNVKIHCDIFGEGYERRVLEKYIMEKKIDVQLKGYDKDVRSTLNRYSLYIHPSKYESFGISILEAMNAGCCVLANSVGGIKEIIDNKTGYLIDCSDPDVLAAQIIYCYNNRDEIREKAICGKQKCATEFFDSVMARNVASLYREMLGDI